MSDSPSTDTKAEPNLTPILDMVFQLITFFMLLASLKSAEADVRLRLPVVGSARPVNGVGDRLLVLNVHRAERETTLTVFGRTLAGEDIKGYLTAEAQASALAAHLAWEDLQKGREVLPDLVVLRADRETPFSSVRSVLQTCQELGYRRIALRAWGQETAQ